MLALAHDVRAQTHQLVMSLDVRPSDAPQFLCVVSSMRSCPKGALQSDGNLKPGAKCDTYELSQLQSLGVLGSWSQRSTEFAAVDSARSILQTHPALSKALDLLAKPVSNFCAGKHGTCRPAIHLAAYRDAKLAAPSEEDKKKDQGRIICGEDLANNSGLVAIVSLSYHQVADSSSVERVVVDGTHATLLLKHELDANNFSFSQVLGGDYEYTPQSAVGTRERVEIPLVRRCKLAEVQLPRHVSQLDTDVVTIDLLRPVDERTTQRMQKEKVELARCHANIREGVFAIQIPYETAPGLKSLRIGTTPRFEATWTEAMPELPLQFAHRSFDFHWRRDCGPDVWPEAPPPNAAWNQRCPRALVEGTTCKLAPSTNPSDHCSYTCEAHESAYPIALPSDVRLERVRARKVGRNVVEEVLYAWSDRVTASGQTLISSAPASDRKLVVDMLSPSNWRPYGGDIVETIRIVYGDGTTADVRPSERNWVSVRAPENACDGSVRVAVLGTRRYEERNRDTPGGRLTLDSPKDFRALAHGYLVVGGAAQLTSGRDAFTPVRAELLATLGPSLEIYWPKRTLTLSLSGLGHLSRLSYGELHPLSERRGAELDKVWFMRLDGTASIVWWAQRRLHVGVGLGGGGGFPTNSSDRDRVGTIRYALFEVFMRFRIGVSQRWVEGAFGVRAGEERRFWETDFTGEPTPTTRVISTPYISVRFRL